LLGFLALLVLLAAFHRPIFFHGTRYFVLRAAKQQNLSLDYQMAGSIFTTLSVVNLKATPTEPGPIQRLEIGTLNLRYSLVDLIRDGLPAFLKELDLRNVYVELTPAEPLPPEKEEKPQAFKFPALFPETLNLANVNLLIHNPAGNTVLEGLYFSLLPDRPGVLKVQTLDIPGVRRWTDIAAATTFRERNLKLTDLFIGREIALREFNLDLTQLEKNELKVGLDGTFFDAPVKLSVAVTDLNQSNHLQVQVNVESLNFDPVWSYLNIPPPFHGKLELLQASFVGTPDQPKEWVGNVQGKVAGLQIDKQRIGDVELGVKLANGVAELSLQNRFDERNTLTVSATGDLPDKLDQFIRTKAQGKLELNVPEAERLTFFMPEVIIGDLSLKTDFTLADGILKTRSQIDSQELSATQADLSGIHFTLDAEKKLNEPEGAPVFQGLVTELAGGIAKVRTSGYEAEAIKVGLSSSGAAVTLKNLELVKAANHASVSASYELPADLKSWDAQPADLSLLVEAPELSAFVAPESGIKLAGLFKLTGQAKMRDKKLSGSLLAEGADIEFNGLPVRTAKVKADIAESRATISELNVVLNDANRLGGGGEVQFGEALVYQGNLDVQMKDLSVLRPILPPDAPDLGGSLSVIWNGSGDSRTPQHTGTASLSLTDARVGENRDLAANFNGSYAADFINVPDFTVSAGKFGDAVFSLFWKANRLQVTNLAVRQQRATLLTGALDVPLHLDKASNINTLLPSNEPLTLSLQSTNVDLAAVARNLGQKTPPVTGRLNLNVNARGTFDDLLAHVTLRATSIQSTAATNFAPADVSVDLDLREDDLLRIDGTVKQKLIQPLRITGVLPCDVAAIKARQAFDSETPVDLSISLPRSSLDFVASLVPIVRSIRGTAEAAVKVKGTIAKPELSGSVTADLTSMRFTDPSLPPINAFALRLDFAGNRVNFTRCRGVVAGGNFLASGNIVFDRLDNPVINLQLGARNVLVLQNDDMTARISSDIRLSGPLSAGFAQGTVWVTRSRFFKNIDILPIGLPGRPAPQPPQEPAVVRFPQPPLRDWKFDVAIKTLDPFLVQSNLATGRIVMDLRLGGTGLDPWLDGTVNVEQLTASLPFSRLLIRDGQVFFTRQQPFVPQLNLRGTSTIRDYNVSVFISGSAYSPEAFFTSDPPLPQAEVVSLLATGMTTSELTRDPNALAGRAAILLFQKAYNSVFRRNRPPAENETFLSRIRFDIGVTDPKTGRQATTLGIPLSENIMLTGGVDVGGNFQGQVKYLIRFK
jgi:hypothetical protein